MLIEVSLTNIDQRKIKQVADTIKAGGVVIVPTDTIYALACDIYNQKAIDRICRIKGVKLEKSNFSFLCDSLQHISKYTKSFDRPAYKLMNRALPGPYTFILEAGSEVPAVFRSRKKTIGIRIPDHAVLLDIISAVGNPLMSTSLHNDDAITEYPTDPAEIFELFEKEVDLIVDAGYGGIIASTIIDCTSAEPLVKRVGAGSLDIM